MEAGPLKEIAPNVLVFSSLENCIFSVFSWEMNTIEASSLPGMIPHYGTRASMELPPLAEIQVREWYSSSHRREMAPTRRLYFTVSPGAATEVYLWAAWFSTAQARCTERLLSVGCRIW